MTLSDSRHTAKSKPRTKTKSEKDRLMAVTDTKREAEMTPHRLDLTEADEADDE